MSTGKVLIGVLAGVAAGAALGILFAPSRGSSTRRKISRKSEEYADAMAEKFNDFTCDVMDKFGKVKKEASGIVKNGKAMVDEAIAEVQSS